MLRTSSPRLSPLSDLATLVRREHANTAELLALIAEVEARSLYLSRGYESMYAYCVGELQMDLAFERIFAARAVHQFPDIFEAVAEGRLSVSAVAQLAPHLTRETVVELVAAAQGKAEHEIDDLLEERFRRPETS